MFSGEGERESESKEMIDTQEISTNQFDVVEASAALERAIENWQHSPVSVIAHHGAQCCRMAREWFLATDYAQQAAGTPHTGPRWLRRKYTWGPSRWPLYWCEAVEQKTLDCGALAALAQEVFAARGIRCYPAQLIQQYTTDAARHWHKRWDEGEVSVHWIKDDLIYHEGCAVSIGDRKIKIWDPTASWWVNPDHLEGYGGLRALRIFAANAESPNRLSWGAHSISPNQWQNLHRRN